MKAIWIGIMDFLYFRSFYWKVLKDIVQGQKEVGVVWRKGTGTRIFRFGKVQDGVRVVRDSVSDTTTAEFASCEYTRRRGKTILGVNNHLRMAENGSKDPN
jgi:hypothetical protein